MILLQPNSSLAFVNMTLSNVSSALAVDPATYAYPVARFLWAWPSLIAEDGTVVSSFQYPPLVVIFIPAALFK